MIILAIMIILSIGKILFHFVRVLSAYVRLSIVCRGTGVRPSDALARVRAQRAS